MVWFIGAVALAVAVKTAENFHGQGDRFRGEKTTAENSFPEASDFTIVMNFD